MLRDRLLAAAAILLPLLLILVADVRWNAGIPGLWLLPGGLVIGLLAVAEFLDLVREPSATSPGYRPVGWSAHLGFASVYLSAFVPGLWTLSGTDYPANCPLGRLGWPLLALAFALAWVLIAEMRRYEQPGGIVVQLALSLFAVVYLGLPMAFAALLRQFHSNHWGMAALVSTIFIVKLSDTGAYFCGKRWGKRKLAPLLSPGKTVAGGLGCLGAAILAALVFRYALAPAITGESDPAPWWGAVLYGAVLAVAGFCGDLSESLLKRDLGRKDSSRWLPGLGGVLDILDSLLLALPVAYLCWAAGLVGPG